MHYLIEFFSRAELKDKIAKDFNTIDSVKMAGATLPSSRSFWKQATFISVLAVFAAYNVKQNVYLRRKLQYRPDELEISRSGEDEYDISKIRPGFPSITGDASERKSEYEGTGDSYLVSLIFLHTVSTFITNT